MEERDNEFIGSVSDHCQQIPVRKRMGDRGKCVLGKVRGNIEDFPELRGGKTSKVADSF